MMKCQYWEQNNRGSKLGYHCLNDKINGTIKSQLLFRFCRHGSTDSGNSSNMNLAKSLIQIYQLNGNFSTVKYEDSIDIRVSTCISCYPIIQ